MSGFDSIFNKGFDIKANQAPTGWRYDQFVVTFKRLDKCRKLLRDFNKSYHAKSQEGFNAFVAEKDLQDDYSIDLDNVDLLCVLAFLDAEQKFSSTFETSFFTEKKEEQKMFHALFTHSFKKLNEKYNVVRGASVEATIATGTPVMMRAAEFAEGSEPAYLRDEWQTVLAYLLQHWTTTSSTPATSPRKRSTSPGPSNQAEPTQIPAWVDLIIRKGDLFSPQEDIRQLEVRALRYLYKVIMDNCPTNTLDKSTIQMWLERGNLKQVGNSDAIYGHRMFKQVEGGCALDLDRINDLEQSYRNGCTDVINGDSPSPPPAS